MSLWEVLMMHKEDTLADLELMSSPELVGCLREYFDVDYFLTTSIQEDKLPAYMRGVYAVINLLERVGD